MNEGMCHKSIYMFAEVLFALIVRFLLFVVLPRHSRRRRCDEEKERERKKLIYVWCHIKRIYLRGLNVRSQHNNLERWAEGWTSRSKRGKSWSDDIHKRPKDMKVFSRYTFPLILMSALFVFLDKSLSSALGDGDGWQMTVMDIFSIDFWW